MQTRTFTSTVTVSVSCGENPEVHEVPVTEGCETAFRLTVERIQMGIAELAMRGSCDKARDIAAQYNEIVGMIRIVTLMTNIYPSQVGRLVYSLRIAAGAAHRSAEARRKL